MAGWGEEHGSERVVKACVTSGLVGGEGFAVNARSEKSMGYGPRCPNRLSPNSEWCFGLEQIGRGKVRHPFFKGPQDDL
jgi:hypothetical protein